MAALGRRGLAPGGVASLTVAGRSTGAARTVPVTPIVWDGRRYLVAPYGPVGWVHNLRAAGEGLLQRGPRAERVRAVELDPRAAAPVLRAYVRRVPIVRPHVAAGPDDDLGAFEAIAPRHPVFALTPDA